MWQISGNTLQGSTIYFYHCCIIYKSILLGPKRLLKAQTFEKTKQHSSEENTSRIIEHHKCQGTFHKGPQGFLTFFEQMIRSLYWDLRGRSKRRVKKRAVFTMTKDFGPFFLVLSSVTNLREKPTRAHKLFLPLLYFLWEHFLGHKGCWNQTFLRKKQSFQWKETNWPAFLVKLIITKIKEQFIWVNKVFW